MAKIVNPKWAEEQRQLISAGQPIDVTTAEGVVARWLIVRLTAANRPYAVHSLGAGVRRITTETTLCPCCKQKLPT